jgi:hypothetical protein
MLMWIVLLENVVLWRLKTFNLIFWVLVVRLPGYRSRGPGFDSRRYQIFWEVVGLERGPLNFASTIEDLLGRNISSSGLENREYGRGDPLRWPRDTLYPQKLALTSLTCGGRSVGIVRLRTKTTEFFLYISTTGCIPWRLVIIFPLHYNRTPADQSAAQWHTHAKACREILTN